MNGNEPVQSIKLGCQSSNYVQEKVPTMYQVLSMPDSEHNPVCVDSLKSYGFSQDIPYRFNTRNLTCKTKLTYESQHSKAKTNDEKSLKSSRRKYRFQDTGSADKCSDLSVNNEISIVIIIPEDSIVNEQSIPENSQLFVDKD